MKLAVLPLSDILLLIFRPWAQWRWSATGVGVDAHVGDEIITSRAGVRVHVGNTDAESCKAMGEVLCRLKMAANEVSGRMECSLNNLILAENI